MSIYYPSGCSSSTVPAYYCSGCIDSAALEFGRIRSIAYIKNTYIDTVLASPTSASVWTTGVNSGDIIVLYQTQGSYAGGTTAELTGFGNNVTINGNTTHELVYRDPFVSENVDFYNALKGSTEYTMAFRTSSKLWYVEEPVTVTPKISVSDDITAPVAMEVTVKWTAADIPTAYDIPTSVFDSCFINA